MFHLGIRGGNNWLASGGGMPDYDESDVNSVDHWWFDDQGKILFDHWRNGRGAELILNDESWGNYMRAHGGLRDALENRISLHQKEGDFNGIMEYDFGEDIEPAISFLEDQIGTLAE